MSRAGLALLLAAACTPDPGPPLAFVPVAPPDVEPRLVVSDPSPVAARARLLADLDGVEGAPVLVGQGPWQTVAVVPNGRKATVVAAGGRTFVRSGDAAGLSVDVRLGAGDRGAFAGGVVPTGIERAMVQVQVEDAQTLAARFRIRVLADAGPGAPPPRDVTPRYLLDELPQGRYRAGVDVPPRGARFLVSVVTVDAEGNAVAHAWASPIAVERPWL